MKNLVTLVIMIVSCLFLSSCAPPAETLPDGRVLQRDPVTGEPLKSVSGEYIYEHHTPTPAPAAQPVTE